MIGQITADRLVYAFLTSLITAEGRGGGREGGGSEKKKIPAPAAPDGLTEAATR